MLGLKRTRRLPSLRRRNQPHGPDLRVGRSVIVAAGEDHPVSVALQRPRRRIPAAIRERHSGPRIVAGRHTAGAPSFTDQWPPGYTVDMEFKRITTNPRQMGGVPCLRGLRIPVATVVALVAEGQTTEGILALYPDLETDDVREALLFAAEAVRERALPLAAGE